MLPQAHLCARRHLCQWLFPSGQSTVSASQCHPARRLPTHTSLLQLCSSETAPFNKTRPVFLQFPLLKAEARPSGNTGVSAGHVRPGWPDGPRVARLRVHMGGLGCLPEASSSAIPLPAPGNPGNALSTVPALTHRHSGSRKPQIGSVPPKAWCLPAELVLPLLSRSSGSGCSREAWEEKSIPGWCARPGSHTQQPLPNPGQAWRPPDLLHLPGLPASSSRLRYTQGSPCCGRAKPPSPKPPCMAFGCSKHEWM